MNTCRTKRSKRIQLRSTSRDPRPWPSECNTGTESIVVLVSAQCAVNSKICAFATSSLDPSQLPHVCQSYPCVSSTPPQHLCASLCALCVSASCLMPCMPATESLPCSYRERAVNQDKVDGEKTQEQKIADIERTFTCPPMVP